jgi:hypothetical protein
MYTTEGLIFSGLNKFLVSICESSLVTISFSRTLLYVVNEGSLKMVYYQLHHSRMHYKIILTISYLRTGIEPTPKISGILNILQTIG